MPDESPIRLGQFLKLLGLVATGGEAKVRIQAGEVKVNGEVDTRRGRRLAPDDVVEFEGERHPVAPTLRRSAGDSHPDGPLASPSPDAEE